MLATSEYINHRFVESNVIKDVIEIAIKLNNTSVIVAINYR